MSKEYISIQDAAEIAGKSVQTIRRAIKAKKLTCKRMKTPQGFNYQISKTSLVELYKLKLEEAAAEVAKEVKEEKAEESSKKNAEIANGDQVTVELGDFKLFMKNMETLMRQHGEERQNFLRLINTLQEKIFVLENQLNLLKEPKKKWYQVWR